MTPTNGNVFIVPLLNIGRVSSGGIHLDKQLYRGLPCSGVVYAVASGVAEIKSGDHVIYNGKKSDMEKVRARDGRALAVVKAGHVLAIVDDCKKYEVTQPSLNR